MDNGRVMTVMGGGGEGEEGNTYEKENIEEKGYNKKDKEVRQRSGITPFHTAVSICLCLG